MFVTRCRHDGLENTYDKLREYVLAHLDARKTAKMTEQAKGTGTQKANAGKGTGRTRPTAKSKSTPGPPSRGAKRQLGDCFTYLETGKCAGKDNGTCPYQHVNTRKGSKGKGKGKRTQSQGPSRNHPEEGEDTSDRRPASADGRSRNLRSPSTDSRQVSGVRGRLIDGKYVPNKTREESVGRSPSGERNRPPCQAWIKGHCATENCRNWHIGDCR